jgi:L-2-hydroxyglutarate oxidase LhgO
VHEYITCLLGDIESHGGSVVFASRFLSARARRGAFTVIVESGRDADEVSCHWLVNSAGLSALPLLASIEGYGAASRRKLYYAKGNYFICQGQRPFTHLVYPMPDEAGLGVHAMLDLDGTTRFGPDVEWVDAPEYSVDPARAADFYRAIREYWPSLEDGALRPAYAGIRPKLVGSGEAAADFTIETPQEHGVPGLINLLGIESPGLTASLAIGDHIAQHLTDTALVGSSLPM